MALKEPLMLKTLKDTQWPAISRRLPQVKIAGVVKLPQDPIARAIRADATVGAMLRAPEMLLEGREFADLWSLTEDEVLAVISDQVWLVCLLWHRLSFVHGDLSSANVASIKTTHELKECREELQAAIARRIAALEDNQVPLEVAFEVDDMPLAGVLDIENSRIVQSDRVDFKEEQAVAMSATQAFWSTSDWALWDDNEHACHWVEADLEALLYVALAILSFKRGREPGQHWLSWEPKEWKKATAMTGKNFRAILSQRTLLPPPYLDMAATWKKHVQKFHARVVLLGADEEKEEEDKHEMLRAARCDLMRDIMLCSSRAALAQLQLEG